MKFLSFCLSVLFSFGLSAHAASGGGHSIGFGLIVMSPSQDDLNDATTAINSSQSLSIDKPSTAYELNSFYQYRFSGSPFAIQFRPSYFMQSASGSGYKTDLSGFTVFPMMRLYPLENNFIHFFMQAGLGYGRLSGTMSGPNTSVGWAGDAFGAMGGIGAEFCFAAAHCLTVEGNLRYLPIQRNLVSSVTGSPAGFDSITDGSELERNNADVKTTLSGIQGMIAYQLYF
jgi:hypothetical protein